MREFIKEIIYANDLDEKTDAQLLQLLDKLDELHRQRPELKAMPRAYSIQIEVAYLLGREITELLQVS